MARVRGRSAEEADLSASDEPRPLPPALERALFTGLCLWGVGVQSNEVVATVGLALSAVGLAARAIHRRERPRGRELLRDWAPLWAFLAWALLAPVIAGRPPTPTAAARLLDWAGLPVAAGAIAVMDARRRRALAVLCGAVLVVSCVMAGLQHFGAWPSEEAMARLAWTKLPFYRVYETVPGHADRFMAGGLLLHRLKFANVTGLGVLWALALGWKARGRARVAGVGVAAVGFVAELAFTYARAAGAALVLSVGVLLLLLIRDRVKALALAAGLAVLAIAVVLASPSVRERFLSANAGEGGGDRPWFLAAGLRAVREHPIAGVGPGHFRPSLFSPPDTPELVLSHPGKSHNQFLSLATEIGIPGAALFLALLLWIGRRLRGAEAAEAGRACLVFFVLVSLLHDPLFHPESSLATVLALGAALGTRRGVGAGAAR